MRKPLLLFIGILFSLTAVFSQSREELERKKKEIQDEIDELQKVQRSLSKDKKTSIGQLTLVQNKLKKRQSVIENINSQVQLIDNDIFMNNREIYRLKNQIDTLKEQYGRTIEYAYKNSSNYDMLNFIFSSTSFNDAIKRISYLKSYRNYRDEQVANINKARASLQGKVATLAANKKEKSNVLVEQSKQLKLLEDEKKEKSVVLTKLQQREKELSKELATKKRVERNLQNAIAAAVKREIEAARKKAEAERKKAEEDAKKLADVNAPKAKPSTAAPAKPGERKSSVLENSPEVTRVSLGFENNRRALPWPVDKSMIVSGFGRRKIEGTTLFEENIGITLETTPGSNVKAIYDGIVSAVFDIAGEPAIIIKHGKYFTTYQNLASVTVSKGQEVKTGQVIGKAGTNEDGDGQILFVVTIESKFVDPEQWLKPR